MSAKIAVSTASRVYTELLRRGLVVGEVGRGTFISGEARRGIAAAEPSRAARASIWKCNYPMLPTQSAMIARSLAGLERAEALELALRHWRPAAGTQEARTISAEFISRKDWAPDPGPTRLHRERPAMHRGGAGGDWCRAAAAAASRR